MSHNQSTQSSSPHRGVELSVIIPAYNESSRLPQTLAQLATFLPPFVAASEVIVVDDGSTDHMVAVVESLVRTFPIPLRIVQLGQNQGKGAAVRAGIALSRGRWVLITDADNATPITELPRLWQARTTADIILGSRYLPDSQIRRAQPLIRRLISRIGNLLIRLTTGLRLTDTQNGFKLLVGDQARQLFTVTTIDRWGFDIELLVIAKVRGLQIVEVPVAWYDASGSKLRAGRDAWRTFKELLRIRFNLTKGQYKS